MAVQLEGGPEGMEPLDQAFGEPTSSPQNSACGQKDGGKDLPSAYSKADRHYLLMSLREGSSAPAGDLPGETGMQLLDSVQRNQVRA